MSDEEKLEKKLQEQEEEINFTLKKLELIQRHKENVIKNCDIIGRKLIQSGEIKMGLRLIANSYPHDCPKLTSPLQFNFLFQTDDKELLKLAISEHNTTSDHHPNFYGGIDFMEPVKIAEVVADLAARSAEQGSCLKDYLTEIYYPKYDIKTNSKVDKYIRKFVGLLLDDKFKTIK